MFSIDGKTILEVSSDIVSRKNQDGTVVLMRMDDSELFYKIDGIAAEFFSQIDGKKNLESLLQGMVEKHKAHEMQLVKDINSFVKKLLDMKMIQKNS